MENIFDVKKYNIISELNVYDKINSKLNEKMISFYKCRENQDKILSLYNTTEKFQHVYIDLSKKHILEKEKIYIFYNVLCDEFFIRCGKSILKNGFEILVEPNELSCYKIIECETQNKNICKIFELFTKHLPLSANFISKNIVKFEALDLISNEILIELLGHLLFTYKSDFSIQNSFSLKPFFLRKEKNDYFFISNDSSETKCEIIRSNYFTLPKDKNLDAKNIFVLLKDLFTNQIYVRRITELENSGLYVCLEPLNLHLFQIKKVCDNEINILAMLHERLDYKGFKSNELFDSIFSNNEDFVDANEYFLTKTEKGKNLTWIQKNIPELSGEKIVYMCMEMFIPEFYEQTNQNAKYNGAVDANFSGGLGILAGCTMEGFANIGLDSCAIIPLYKRRRLQTIDENLNQVIYEEEIDYGLNKNLCKVLNDETGEQLEISVYIDNKKYTVKIWEIFRGGSRVFLLDEPNVFDILYTGDRNQRLLQEILIGKVTPFLLKILRIKPAILHLNEAHAVLAAVNIREWKNMNLGDDFFENTRVLFTIHTPRPAGMEVFFVNFYKLEIPYSYKNLFDPTNSGKMDFTNVAVEISDRVNTVSNNQIRIVKERIIKDPKFHGKIIGILNGTSKSYWISENTKELLQKSFLDPVEIWEMHKKDKEKVACKMLEIFEREGIKKTLELDKNVNLHLDPRKPSAWAARRIVDYKNQWPFLKDIIRVVCTEKGQKIETNFGEREGLGFQVVMGGVAHPNDATSQIWIREFLHWMKGLWRDDLSKDYTSVPELVGNFFFIPSYNEGLGQILKMSALACDVCLEIPMWDEEACGTSGMRAMSNGNICIDSSDGALEWLEDHKNSLFLKPYSPAKLLENLQIISNLYHDFLNKELKKEELERDVFLLMKKEAILTYKNILDIDVMAQRYAREMFFPADKIRKFLS